MQTEVPTETSVCAPLLGRCCGSAGVERTGSYWLQKHTLYQKYTGRTQAPKSTCLPQLTTNTRSRKRPLVTANGTGYRLRAAWVCHSSWSQQQGHILHHSTLDGTECRALGLSQLLNKTRRTDSRTANMLYHITSDQPRPTTIFYLPAKRAENFPGASKSDISLSSASHRHTHGARHPRDDTHRAAGPRRRRRARCPPVVTSQPQVEPPAAPTDPPSCLRAHRSGINSLRVEEESG